MNSSFDPETAKTYEGFPCRCSKEPAEWRRELKSKSYREDGVGELVVQFSWVEEFIEDLLQEARTQGYAEGALFERERAEMPAKEDWDQFPKLCEKCSGQDFLCKDCMPEDWFDSTLGTLLIDEEGVSIEYYPMFHKRIKSFIRQTLTTQRQAILDEVRGKVEEERRLCTVTDICDSILKRIDAI